MQNFSLVDGVDVAYIPGAGRVAKGDVITGDYEHLSPYPLKACEQLLVEPAPAPEGLPPSVEADAPEAPSDLLLEIPEAPAKENILVEDEDAPKKAKKGKKAKKSKK